MSELRSRLIPSRSSIIPSFLFPFHFPRLRFWADSLRVNSGKNVHSSRHLLNRLLVVLYPFLPIIFFASCNQNSLLQIVLTPVLHGAWKREKRADNFNAIKSRRVSRNLFTFDQTVAKAHRTDVEQAQSRLGHGARRPVFVRSETTTKIDRISSG